MSTILIAAVLCGLAANADCAQAQQPQGASLSGPPQTAVREASPQLSKTELVRRFEEIKNLYIEIKTVAAKYAPLTPDASSELRVTRLKIGDAMRAYDHYEDRAQKQRDQLNLLVELTELQSLRLQIAMDRLSKMRAMISNLMRKMNGTGNAIIANTEGAAPARRSSQNH